MSWRVRRIYLLRLIAHGIVAWCAKETLEDLILLGDKNGYVRSAG